MPEYDSQENILCKEWEPLRNNIQNNILGKKNEVDPWSFEYHKENFLENKEQSLYDNKIDNKEGKLMENAQISNNPVNKDLQSANNAPEQTLPPQIKITAQPSPTDPKMCRFNIETSIYTERWVRISRSQAEHSPLAQKIFEIPQITSIRFSDKTILAFKDDQDPWQPLARQIGPAIRAHIATGLPAITVDPDTLNEPAKTQEELFIKVQEVIDTWINPNVAGHGGHVRLLSVEGDTAYIHMGGGCQGCGMADVTLKQGIVTTIRSNVPEILHVLDSTDHENGENPYYSNS